MSRSVLVSEFEKLKEDIIALYDAKGMRASGEFAESLEVVATDSNVKLLGNDYAQKLEAGQEAGEYPDVNDIVKWIKNKNIASKIKGKITVSALAFLIARKIGREGWDRKDYGGVNLISEVVTNERMQEIIDKFGGVETLKFLSEIDFLIDTNIGKK